MNQDEETFVLFVIVMLLLKMMFCRIFSAILDWYNNLFVQYNALITYIIEIFS